MKFKQKILQRMGLWVVLLSLITPLAWISVSHPQRVQDVGNIVSQNKYLFLIFRWLIILAVFLCWRRLIGHIGLRRGWSVDKTQFWQKQRFKVVIWLALFELVLCENLLLILFHLIERVPL